MGWVSAVRLIVRVLVLHDLVLSVVWIRAPGTPMLSYSTSKARDYTPIVFHLLPDLRHWVLEACSQLLKTLSICLSYIKLDRSPECRDG